MEMNYSIFHHPEVIKKDIPKLDTYWRQEVRDAIRGKLTVNPNLYGVYLRQSLKGLRKLRVGDYRVLYRVTGRSVFVVIIGHRSVVYDEVKMRLGLS